MPLIHATQSYRYTRPRAALLAVRSAGPGRAAEVLRFYRHVEQAGGLVWDFDLKFADVDARVELPGATDDPAWGDLVALVKEMESLCEACGAPGDFRGDLEWFRVLCEAHHSAICSGAWWQDLYAPFWEKLLPGRPDLWPAYARGE